MAMTGPGGARASLVLYREDCAGNWPMKLEVSGLKPLPAGKTYSLWLTRHGKLADPCGTFAVGERYDEGTAQRAVPSEGLRRVGRRSHRRKHAVAVHRLSAVTRIHL